MKKILFLIVPSALAIALITYPTLTTSYPGGSPGGKTNSPLDNKNCTECHSGTIDTGIGSATISSNIPSTGYAVGNTYTITVSGTKAACLKFGFELTAENGISKEGDFIITDSGTKLVNQNKSVTQTGSGTSGSTTKSWSVNWTTTTATADSVTFYASIMFSDKNGSEFGDNVFTTSASFNREVIIGINELEGIQNFNYNSVSKTIKNLNNTTISLYDINGKKLITSNDYITLHYLATGIYIIKSGVETQKIFID